MYNTRLYRKAKIKYTSHNLGQAATSSVVPEVSAPSI